MHLVDAIRMAAAKTATTQPATTTQATVTSAVTAPNNMETPNDNPEFAPQPAPSAQPQQQPESPIAGTGEVSTPVPVHPVVPAAGGSVVRLELFLSQEQMNQMLRGILQGAHTVMTLREAAQYLRVNNETLTHLAESGEIGGFIVEGRWKFPRHSLEEWITLQSLSAHRTAETQNQEQENAA
jgi:excisionase family DNA binding protein